MAENARQRFGDRAEQAYRELAQFSIDQWLRAPLVDPGAPDPTPAALSDGIAEHLDPATLPHWQVSVAAALQGNSTEVATVRMLRFFKLQAPTLRLPEGGKSPISRQGITEGTVGLGEVRPDGIYPLVVSFRQRARLELMSGRSANPVSLRKKVTFTVVPVAELARVTPQVTPSATAVVSRPADVHWLITTFQGDIATSEGGDGDDGGDSSPSGTGSPTTNPAAQVPTMTRSPAR